MVMAALRSDAAVGRTLPLAGPKAWSTEEVIALCEKLADCDAEVGGPQGWCRVGRRTCRWECCCTVSRQLQRPFLPTRGTQPCISASSAPFPPLPAAGAQRARVAAQGHPQRAALLPVGH